ncbi:MFS transporter [Paraburkholderia phymatum]|uniref:MFS transporter n=1 Tax=Paraburkholderia phymatum TaxID=148447 RepID=UPI0031743892
MSTVHTIDVQAYVDGQKISPFQSAVVALCFAVVAIDGFDTAAVGFIAPALRAEWGLAPARLAPLFAAGLLGLMIGAMVFGPIADRIGRKPVLLLTTAFFAVASLLSTTAADIHWLTFWRLVTGIGLGGAMPTATTLTAEYCPGRTRSLTITVMFCGFTLGGMLGGLASAGLVEDHGWKAVFMLGGLAPLVLLVFLVWFLPESPRYLAMKGGHDGRIAAILSRIQDAPELLNAHFLRPQVSAGSPVRKLFAPGLARGTILLWLTFFMSLLVFYLLTSWLPTLLTGAGQSLRTAALVGLVLPLGSTVGAVVIGYGMDKADPHRVLAASYVLGAVSIAALGYATPFPTLLVLTVFGAGIGSGGALIGVNALTASFYPTANRATGVSWANAIGRTGSIFGSAIGGYLLGRGWSMLAVFTVAALPALIAAITILGKRRIGMNSSAPSEPQHA